MSNFQSVRKDPDFQHQASRRNIYSTSSSKYNTQAQVVCQICGKPKHIASECWYRYDFSQSEEEVPQALAAMNINEVPDPNWYVKTGATAHMTPDQVLLLPLYLIQKKIKYM